MYTSMLSHNPRCGLAPPTRSVAWIVDNLAAPQTTQEQAIVAQGARITRLTVEQLRASHLDTATLQLLGRLYDEVVVPFAWETEVKRMAQLAGIPVTSR